MIYCTESVSLFGEPVHRTSINPSTPLMAASSQGHTEIVKLLIESGSEVSFVDEEGYSALRWALRGEHERTSTVPATVIVLLESGANDPSVLFTTDEGGEIVKIKLLERRPGIR